MKDQIIDLLQTVIAALDSGKYANISVADVEAAWKRGQIIGFLREVLKSEDLIYTAFYYDAAKYDGLEGKLNEHFAAYLPKASKYSGVANSGLCCIAGGLAQLLRTL